MHRLLTGFPTGTSLMIACMVGGIGFIIGFVGPMVFTPESNQGPLLGIFITGPLGFIIGGAIGAYVDWRRGKRLR